MTLVNIHVKDEEKKKLQNYVENHTDSSMSDFVRTLISDHLKMEELIAKIPDPVDVEIPDYVPKNKYVVLVNGALVAVGDNPSDLADIAVQKFPDYPFIIKYNGPPEKRLEYVYMSLAEWHAWKYVQFNETTYPTLPVKIICDKDQYTVNASLDTASTVCILDENFIPQNKFQINRKCSVSTAAGIVEREILLMKLILLDGSFDIEFILAPIPKSLPFKFLIGRNLLDQLDAYLLGKRQVIMLKRAN